MSEQTGKTETRFKLLIVEDDEQLRHVLLDDFRGAYEVAEAEDGQGGLERAFEVLPDLVISDIMMPEMDGNMLCQKLKSDPATSHIPVVMLTAKTAVNSQIEGLQHGADYYVTKPFDPDFLQPCVANLLQSRKALREQMSRELSLESLASSGRTTDEVFLRRVIGIVERNLAVEDFGPEELAGAVGMSLRNFQRKMKQAFGIPPSKLLSEVRIRHAARLLCTTSMTASEIAHDVGFDNSSNFAQAFRQYHGKSPTEFRKTANEADASKGVSYNGR